MTERRDEPVIPDRVESAANEASAPQATPAKQAAAASSMTTLQRMGAGFRNLIHTVSGAKAREEMEMIRSIQKYGGIIKKLPDGSIEFSDSYGDHEPEALACACRVAIERNADIKVTNGGKTKLLKLADARKFVEEICMQFPQYLTDGKPSEEMLKTAAGAIAASMKGRAKARFIDGVMHYKKIRPIFAAMWDNLETLEGQPPL